MKRPELLFIFLACAGSMVGCSSDTSLSSAQNQAYHSKVAPKPPTAEQLKPKGPAFVGQPMGVGGGKPPTDAMGGPQGASH
jgi:hypothetical protein